MAKEQKKIANIYISSIYQHAGKTTLALGLYKAFQERKLKTSFLKPVGQQAVHVKNRDIDKDSYLIGEVYHCRTKLEYMSPVTLGHGFTEKYISNPQPQILRKKIMKAFSRLKKGKDAIIVEGTGHAGVGSVVDLSNATVARMLESKVIIVSEGGIGRSIDEIMLNKALFDLMGVEVLGVVINKVIPRKYQRIKKILKQGLHQKKLKLLGVIPADPLLSRPSIEHIMEKLKLKLLCGHTNIRRNIHNTIVAAMEPENMVEYIDDGALIITSGDRVDNIMVAVSSHLIRQGQPALVSGMILSGGLIPDRKILELLKKSEIPVLLSNEDTYTIAGRMENLVCKIEKKDKDKIQSAAQLVKKYVDIGHILDLARK